MTDEKDGKVKKKRTLYALLSLLVCLAFCFSAVSCGDGRDGADSEDSGKPKPYENTILIYMCGSDLETKFGSATDNLGELMESGIPGDTAVIVQTGGAKAWRNYGIANDSINRYRIENGELALLQRLPQDSMGDARTLADFLNYGITEFPARNTGIIFWDHGGGGLGGICFDELHDYDSLSLPELDSALSEARGRMDRNFELIGFDACLMANIETADVVSRYADFMIASEEREPLGGWDYRSLAANFGNESGYQNILDDFAEKSVKAGADLFTLSCMDMSGYGAVKAAFDNFADMLNSLESLKPAAISAQNSMAFGCRYKDSGSDMIDLSDFAEGMGVKTLQTEIKNCVFCANSVTRTGADGLSVFFPCSFDPALPDRYEKLAATESYKSFIKNNFSAANEETIVFTDRGSDRNGELHIEISPESEKYVRSVKYKIFRFVQESEYFEKIYCLGCDSDMIYDGKTGYTTSFKGRWAVWNGEYISCNMLDESDGVTLFASPVKLNGVRGDAIFSYRLSDRSFDLHGFSENCGSGASARLVEFQPDDRITLLYDDRTYSYTGKLCEGKTFTVKDGISLSLKEFPAGYFQSYVIVTDIFGQEYRTNPAVSYWNGDKMEIIVLDPDSDNNDLI